MTASPTRSPRRGVRGALSAINVPASGTKSAAKARRIVFDASKRKAQKQPSPQKNVRRSPPLQRRRVARVSYDPDDSADASFNPVVATETPQMVQPPDVAAITQSQADIQHEPPTAAVAAAAFAASVESAPKPKGKPRVISTYVKNIRAVHNNQFHSFARPDLLQTKGKVADIDLVDFNKWEKKFNEQMRVCFQRRQVSHASRVDNSGRGLRSAGRDEMLFDDEAAMVETTDIRRLTRYPFEKLLLLEEDSPLVIYFRKGNTVLNDLFSGIPESAARVQRKEGIAGQVETIGGSKYICLRTNMTVARYHQQINSGQITLRDLEKLYKEKQGFTVEFAGTNLTIPFTWMDTVEFAEDILFFGPPLDNVPRFNLLFKVGRVKPDYLRAIYRGIARETMGDVRMSQALSMEFHRRMAEVTAAELERERVVDKLLTFDEV